MAQFYVHRVNGRIYDSRGLEMHGTRIYPESLAHYKRIVREAYGTLRGVTFETIHEGEDYECGHCGRFFTHENYRRHMGQA